LPKLSRYYLLLAIILFVSSVALPYVVPAALFALAQFFGGVIESTAFAGPLVLYVALFLFTVAFMTVYFAGRILKSRVLGFPRSLPSTYIEEQFERLLINAKWAESPPYELSHRPVFEDSEVEERKRKALVSKE